VEHWVVAQRQGQTAARNILGAREPFTIPPFFWSNHFVLHVQYVGHASGSEEKSVSGDLERKHGSVLFRSDGKLRAVASIGRHRENLKAEVALDRCE
jgi:NADPH-dependent 2,4-dienoyl-CoA reductase/sulfur reductase-like enzyme